MNGLRMLYCWHDTGQMVALTFTSPYKLFSGCPKQSERGFIRENDFTPVLSSAVSVPFAEYQSEYQVLGPWPGNSPELNPIENLWSILKRWVDKQNPTNSDKLQALIMQVSSAGALLPPPKNFLGENMGSIGHLGAHWRRGLLGALGNRGLLGALGRRGHLRALGRRGHLGALGRRGHLRALGRRGHLRALARSGLWGALARSGLWGALARSGLWGALARSGLWRALARINDQWVFA